MADYFLLFQPKAETCEPVTAKTSAAAVNCRSLKGSGNLLGVAIKWDVGRRRQPKISSSPLPVADEGERGVGRNKEYHERTKRSETTMFLTEVSPKGQSDPF